MAHVQGTVTFRPGTTSEAYRGIGKGSIPLRGLPLFADDLGPFGSPTSDSERTMIRPDTVTVALIIIAACGAKDLPSQANHAAHLLRRHASARDVVVEISSPGDA